MTSPPQEIRVKCPKCGNVFGDWYRPSVNLMLDDFDDDYLDECSSATCPACGYTIELDTLVVDKEGTFMGNSNNGA
jgi:uncharacterized protein (UPF0212 family)